MVTRIACRADGDTATLHALASSTDGAHGRIGTDHRHRIYRRLILINRHLVEQQSHLATATVTQGKLDGLTQIIFEADGIGAVAATIGHLHGHQNGEVII